jgi:bifunctional non-homologous end joining protein LigD
VPARGSGSARRGGADAGRRSEPGAPGAPGALKRYRAKRDFERTPEPSGAQLRAGGDDREAGRFVIHEHHASRLHWDLRLERDGVLVSWAIPKGMPPAPKENRFAAATEDHPLAYLAFHGEIPRGQYGAGEMSIWDHGTYRCLKWEPRKVEVLLEGKRLQARYALFAIDKEEPAKDWMIHRMDPAADPAAEPMPSRIVPMLAGAGPLPGGEGWAFEIKWDGVRALAYTRPGELRLESRNLNDITRSYPELSRLGEALGSREAVLDGEIVALDESARPSFETLQRRMHVGGKAQVARLAKEHPVTYMIFDLLWLDGQSLMGEPYLTRRERLLELSLSGAHWQTPAHHVGDGAALLRASAEQGLEGILAKRIDSRYEPGQRARGWVKIKTVARQEFVIGGWLAGKGKRDGSVGALLLGVNDPGGGLRYVGRVGSGFSDRELERLSGLLLARRRKASPFRAGAKPPRESLFCEPELVAEAEFSQWTRTGSLRAPSYKGLREDKAAADVVREPESPHAPPAAEPGRDEAPLDLSAASATTVIDGRELKFSNLAKTIYPSAEFSKRDLIGYYASIAPVLLPHLRDRPLTVTRWPDGVEGKSFFQKQSPAHRPQWVATQRVESASKPIDYTLADDLPTLLWLANLAAIELHAPLARRQDMTRPSALVFDLDPGPPAGLLECCRVALQLQGMFENLGLDSYVKTSGSKGLQVYLPLNGGRESYEQTKPFARAVAELLESAEADLVVSRMTKTRRTGKVLIDWSQNDARKTTICVYSLRPAERPTVSTPLEWDEVRSALDAGHAEDLSFEAPEVLERVSKHGDLFARVLSQVQALPEF